ncbi:MAG: hypothetical protein AAFQ11_10145, partial [Pseudomonadota bacterium]
NMIAPIFADARQIGTMTVHTTGRLENGGDLVECRDPLRAMRRMNQPGVQCSERDHRGDTESQRQGDCLELAQR